MEDTFQVRLDFVSLLRRLNASQQSIHKVLAFADRHAAKSSGDIWDCLLSECGKASLSSRLNILFLLDALFTDYASSHNSQSASRALLLSNFRSLAQRDLPALIDAVVPSDSWQGIKLNSAVTIQVLTSWRLKRLFPQEHIAELLETIEERKRKAAEEHHDPGEAESNGLTLTKDEVMRRIEEDRERHKRIREKLWVLPPKSYVDAARDSKRRGASPSSAAASYSATKRQRVKDGSGDAESATTVSDPSVETTVAGDLTATLADVHEIQFEELWETTSDLNEDDLVAWKEEEEERWWGSEKLHEQRRLEEEEQAAAAARLEEEKRKREEEEAAAAAAAAAAEQAEKRRLEREERQARWARAAPPAAEPDPRSRWPRTDPPSRPPAAPRSSEDSRWPSARPPPPGPPPRAPALHAAASSTPTTSRWDRRQGPYSAAATPPTGPSSRSTTNYGTPPTGPGRRRWGG